MIGGVMWIANIFWVSALYAQFFVQHRGGQCKSGRANLQSYLKFGGL
jgi:hypothetical protein